MEEVLLVGFAQFWPCLTPNQNAAKALNQVLSSLRLEKHPDKTFVGRIEKGFDFLSYHVNPAGLTVAHDTFVRFVARARA